ncbi:MAG: FAD-dependent oxidoreductase [Deltaproteobacteria bacterium]|nr:FAD-dependent oxidoreductase [Deltaproteobacteria bacterium]
MTLKGEDVVGSAMVVGGGIAGVQAALDLADGGYFVYLVESSPAIGGVMAQLDKTFPTNDCSMCILSPKLVDVGRHPNIQLLTESKVEGVEGRAGRFQVRVRKKPRYIDLSKCTACGDCAQVCPVSLESEFEQGLSMRKAVYKPYAQAIPGAYTIDKRDRSPCTNACPNQVNAHGYVALIARGQYREAMEVILRNLPLPGVIGRICPHPCETACRRGRVDQPLSICALKRFVADRVDLHDIPLPEIKRRDEKVAVIGSGPAGLSAAYFLALEGFGVTIFEALPVAGGMLRVGIPDYRLPPEVLDREILFITRLGVEIKLNKALGRDMTLDDLTAQGYKAVYLSIGAHASLRLNIPGEDADGVIPGVEFLREVNLGERKELRGRVIIVGGGDVAVDAARCARRLGGDEVSLLYRRTRNEMSARENEVQEAKAEGIEIQFLTAPQQILTRNNRVIGLQCVRMELGDPDSSGRRRPIPKPGSEFVIEADWVIPAIGQTPASAFLMEEGVRLSRWGTIETDAITFETSRPGVFAGGDAQSGPWVAIGAIAAGREAAVSIARYLSREDLKAGRQKPPRSQEDFVPIPKDVEKRPRAAMATVSPHQRGSGFAEVEIGLTEEQALAEASKCLNCMACSECLQCVAACKAGAVDHGMEEEFLTLEVGAIIAAPGAATFDPSLKDTFGYGVYPNVVTSIEFERILSASGPFQGHLVRPSDHQEPRRIAWLQCVGSRDVNHCRNGYCSAVCCMCAIKEAVIAKEHSREPLDASIFFIDMRTTGKDFEKYYDCAREEHGIHFVRSRIHSVERIDENDNLLLRYVTEDGLAHEEEFDMVVLSVGLEVSPEVSELAARLGIQVGDERYATTSPFAPVSTSRPGIFVCGTFQGPKDIPQSVMEASAAAAETSAILASARGSRAHRVEEVATRDISQEEPRVGVFICHCGINIGSVVDVPAVKEYAKTLPHVVYAEENLFTCSQDTQVRMQEVIRDQRLNRIVVASCTPRTHEALFQQTILGAGLNKYLFELANIRDQDSWVHQAFPEEATAKAKDLVRMAVARVVLQSPIEEIKLPVVRSALVVGGGVSGMEAALALADQGYPVTLIERKDVLGGHARKLLTAWTGDKIRPYLDALVERVQQHPGVSVLKRATLEAVRGFVGNFCSTVLVDGKTLEVHHGVAILAVGAHSFKPSEYGYGRSPRIFQNLELDEAIQNRNTLVFEASSVVFIQCVGSREPERPYCSRVCCSHSIENALRLKEINPSVDVFILYRDIRTFGLRENLYKEARSKGVLFIRFDVECKPEVEEAQDGLIVSVYDPILQRKVLLRADILTLATAIETRELESLARMFKVPLNAEGFFLEAHMKLRPVDFATEGVFVAGLAHWPKPIEECIAQAKAAASRASTVLSREFIAAGGVTASINKELCVGCQACLECCPFGAINEVQQEANCEVNQALCKGCGTCAATCPSEAITLWGFSNRQLYRQIDEALSA